MEEFNGEWTDMSKVPVGTKFQALGFRISETEIWDGEIIEKDGEKHIYLPARNVSFSPSGWFSLFIKVKVE